MTSKSEIGEYKYISAAPTQTANYLWPKVEEVLKTKLQNPNILDLGCGNGAFTMRLAQLGYDVIGIDPSESGISHASKASADIRFEVGSAYDDLRQKFGAVDCVVSLEVVEHLYSPKLFAENIFKVLRPGGIGIISTPYHGYWKNLALAATGSMDKHFTALWDHGHIKFWSVKTLSKLFEMHGLKVDHFRFAGRFSLMAKSMIAVVSKPQI